MPYVTVSNCWMLLIARVTGVPPATLNKAAWSATSSPTASILLTAGARSLTGG